MADYEFTDFQQLASWRRLVPTVADELVAVTGQRLVAVRTVLVEAYWRELLAGLRSLGHEVETQARQWRLDYLEVYRQAHDWMIHTADVVIDTSCLDAEQTARQVMGDLGYAG